MNGLTTALLHRACRIFLERAYPEGSRTIPPPIRGYFDLRVDQPLEALLLPPLCQPLPVQEGALRGYVLRLGSALHPHLKLRIVDHGDAGCVFAVDTHDAIFLDSSDPDATRWMRFQHGNRQLKEQIERAWEEAGLLTFNALLRHELARK
ncbi:MAG TPA: hypothetical protein VN688_34945 [Gemmataceae bacterium]|nr:hypothetical protein [Gemmataceae bacterium]